MIKIKRILFLLFILISFLLVACDQEGKYTIYFDSNGGSEVSSIKTNGNENIILPDDPEKEGYQFDGWYKDNNTFRKNFREDSLLGEPIDGDITVYAKWKSNVTYEDLEIVSATGFEIYDMDLYIAVPNSTETFSLVDKITVKPSITWVLYSDSGNEAIASKTVDLAVGMNRYRIEVSKGDQRRMYWVLITRLAMYEISFDTDGGEVMESQYVEEGEQFNLPAEEPIKEGYTFKGWKDSRGLEIDFPIEVINDIVITAIWQANENTLFFDPNGGLGDAYSILVKTDETITLPANTFTKDGFTFDCWSTSAEGIDEYLDESNYTMGAEGSYTLYAQWTKPSTEGLIFAFKGDDTYEVIGYEGTLNDVYIGRKHEGKPIRSIGITAFQNCSILNSITLSSSIISIGNGAFKNCENLTSITFSPNLVTIGGWVFESCSQLTNITFPESLKTIESDAFKGCIGLTSLTFPKSVTSISMNVFTGCNNLKSIFILGTPRLYYGAFHGCTNAVIYAEAEEKPESWRSATIHDSIPVVMGYVSHNVTLDGIEYAVSLIDSKYSVMITGYTGDLSEVVIPETIEDYPVTNLGSSAFKDCTTLTNITIPANVTSIGVETFVGCTNLKSIVIPETVESIGTGAFKNYTSLKIYAKAENKPDNWADGWDVYKEWGVNSSPVVFGYVSNGVSLNGIEYAMSLIDSTYSVVITGYQGTEAELVIPDKIEGYPVKILASSAFNECSTLTSVTLLEGITSIGKFAFYRCDKLRSINISDTVTSIGDYAFGTCTLLSNVILPEGLTSIGSAAFMSCHLKSIVIPEGIERIESSTFTWCCSLESITLPSTLTSIGSQAFWQCDSLKRIIIPAGVTNINTAAFAYCDRLTIYCEVASKPDSWDNDWNSSTRPVIWDYMLFAKEFEIDETNLSIEVSHFTTTFSFINYIIVHPLATWELYSDLEATNKIVSKSIELAVGDNTAYIKVIKGSESAIYKAVISRRQGYVISFDNNGGTGEMEGITIDVKQTIKLPKNEFTKAGYNFLGWATTESGDVEYLDEANYTISVLDNYTLFAKWEANQNTLSFNANTGTGEMNSVQIKTDNSIYLPINKFTKTGYTFIGWATTANGDVEYLNEAKYTMGVLDNYTLFAKWEANQNTLSFNANTGLGEMSNVFVKTDDFIYLPTNTFVKPGYTFIGWATTANGDVEYLDEAKYTMGVLSSYTLFAKWEENDSTEGLTFTLKEDDTYEVTGYAGESLDVYIAEKYLGKAITSIAASAFEDCDTLTSIIIPSGVVTIGANAFKGCSNLTIFARISAKTLGWHVNWNTENRPVVFGYVASGVTLDGFKYGIVLINFNYGVAIYGYTGGATTVLIPETIAGFNVRIITNSAFRNCGITEVTIPSTVTSIGSYAFYNCCNLTGISIPTAVTSIEDYTFFNSGLTSITMPGIKSIGERAFAGCIGFTSMALPEGLLSIGETAFESCYFLTNVTIPNTVTTIDYGAFKGCTRLERIIIPNNVTHMDYSIFWDCLGMPIYVEVESKPANWHDSWNMGYNAVVWGYVGHGFTANGLEYGISKVNSIYSVMITSYGGVSTELEIPSTIENHPVTTIGNWAFVNCANLTSITIPSSITSIGQRAFHNCGKLANIIIPTNVTNIGTYAFCYCFSLTIYAKAETKPTGWDNTWNPSERPVVWGYVSNSVTADGIEYVVSLIDSNYSVSIAGYEGTVGVLTIPSTIEGHSVTTILKEAFDNNAVLTNVTISGGITSIGYRAFRSCTNLTSITIPEGVTIIDGYTFENCTSLTSITLPEGVTKVNSYAFCGCNELLSVNMPSTLTSIGMNAFKGCAKLVNINLPAALTSISSEAFINCTSLTSIIIPSNVTVMLQRVFAGCSSLTIYCEAVEQPTTWFSDWNPDNRPVVWGYTG